MIVFFDIDGTLVDDATQIIPESAARAVRQLQENGHVAVINTGRPFTHLDPRVAAMGFRGSVCACGMEVLLDGKWVSRQYPSREVQLAAIEAARKYHMRPCYESDPAVILLDGDYTTNPRVAREIDLIRSKGFDIQELSDHPNLPFIKLIAFRDDDSDVDGYVKTMSQWFTVIDRGGGMVELVLDGCSKAAGMQIVMDHLGVTADQVLAIGDSTNDLPMFSLAGHTVCMGNGADQVKQVSEYITASVMEDGIEKALRHYGLIEQTVRSRQ